MYLYGASGHAKVIIDILETSGVRVDGLIDDNPNINQLQGYPVRHTFTRESPFIISIGNNKIRKQVAERLQTSYGKAIHSSAILSPTAKIGDGTVVMQGAIIQADAKIGKHCIINTGASVDHECVIGDYVHVSPHATLCGNVHVGEGSWIGAGTTVIPNLSIGKWCVIGAGSVITENIPDHVLAFGNPCRIIRYLE
jgi:sugar O-acyltransferase (sialic acid O-acetyltransferase NeuD family)